MTTTLDPETETPAPNAPEPPPTNPPPAPTLPVDPPFNPPPPDTLTPPLEVRAIGAFARALERMTPRGRQAAIHYIASLYGITIATPIR